MNFTDRKPRKLHVVTHGCQMNVYDSARMADLLAPLGYTTVDQPEGADMVIMNTCHIRERAEEKVFSALGRLRVMKEEAGGKMMIAVTGCVAQAESELLLQRAPFVDLVVGPQAYHRLPELIAQAHRTQGSVIDTDFPAEPKFDFLPDARGVAGGDRQPHHPGRLRQVLLLLRRALHARRRSLAPGGAGDRRGQAHGGPGHARNRAARAERERLSWRGAGRENLVPGAAAGGAGRGPGPQAAALHHLAPERHDRGADPGAPGQSGADAVSAPAGAIGLGQNSRRHEPQA